MKTCHFGTCHIGILEVPMPKGFFGLLAFKTHMRVHFERAPPKVGRLVESQISARGRIGCFRVVAARPAPDPRDRAAALRRAPRSHRGGVEPSERKPSWRSRNISKARLGRGETRSTRRMVCTRSRRSGRQADCRKGVAIQPSGLRRGGRNTDTARPAPPIVSENCKPKCRHAHKHRRAGTRL